MYVFMYDIIVYSIPATGYKRKKERITHPHNLKQNTDTKQTFTMTIELWVPSLENWGGGLKSLLWLANSPYTPLQKCPGFSGLRPRDFVRDRVNIALSSFITFDITQGIFS